ncbi:hypothetical protein BOX15_Mlig022739g2 [Macrostomum lignano]|uniref:BTB domain-containing protein n=1 Tax=Macrostomum lignano TaxID=282301 RepID=A0A267FNN6_9PLAT|nr:hypothetical protein BOX15_Mlig022739g2 [Macrostomum lignano]
MGAAPSALTDSSSASLGQFGCHGNSSEKSQPLSTGSANSFAPSGHSRQSSSSSSATARLQQTLKRRVAWLRRRSSPDPAKQFRAFIADWSSADLRVLLDEFEALHALKDAHLGAAAARPQCSSLCQDLGCLLRTGLGSDARLILGGVAFPVHRAVLAARSNFFARLFANGEDYDSAATGGADYPLDLCVPGGLDPELLRALLAYLYCGEVSLARLSAPATVAALCHELGAPGRLSDDLAQLLDTGHLADCVLIFEEAEPRARRIELPCHRALLACRSPFFAGVVEKRLAAARRHRRRRLVRCAVHGGGDGVGDAQLAEPPLALVLDEAVLPRRLAPAMLTCLYTDRLPDCLALRDLMDLHEIGRFLELPCLTRASEDLLVESLCPDTLVPVLDWSGAGTGSAWVHRQARLFLCEEFAALAVQAPRVLTQLSRRELLAALRSDFLQAAESDVLSALIAWGEAQVAARAAEIVAESQQTGAPAGFSRKTGGGGGLSSGRQKRAAGSAAAAAASEELSSVLGDLVSQGLRLEHLLCPDSLQEAVRRKLLPKDAGLSRPAAWLHAGGGGGSDGGYRHPRLFAPHLEEIRSVLSDRTRDLTLAQCPPEPPRRLPASPQPAAVAPPDAASAAAAAAGLWGGHGGGGPDLVATLPPGCSPIDPATAASLLRRVQELLSGSLFVRAGLLPAADRAALHRQAQLWAVREFGLPDSAAALLPGRLPDVAFHA